MGLSPRTSVYDLSSPFELRLERGQPSDDPSMGALEERPVVLLE
jgi:hypothetical protein